ncbi:hypothetical protein D3C72_1432450 [compost metagenome]
MLAVAVCAIAFDEAAPTMAVIAGCWPSVFTSAKKALIAPVPFSATTAGYLLSSTMLYSGSWVLAR